MVIGESRHGAADWTAAMVPPASALLEQVAADAEQLAVLDDILARWPRRSRIDLDTIVDQAWYDDPGARTSVELGMRTRLLSQAEEHWPDAMVLRLRLAWERWREDHWRCSITALVLPALVPDTPTDTFPAVAGGTEAP